MDDRTVRVELGEVRVVDVGGDPAVVVIKISDGNEMECRISREAAIQIGRRLYQGVSLFVEWKEGADV